MSRLPPINSKKLAGTTQRLLLGARRATGAVIAYSPERNRVPVRWDDTGKVNHCLRSKPVSVR
jgi:hypothetical protein